MENFNLPSHWLCYCYYCREVALTVLLLASGVSLDATMLRKLKFVVFQLAVLPCVTETVAAAVVTHYLMGLPWIWGILLGYKVPLFLKHRKLTFCKKFSPRHTKTIYLIYFNINIFSCKFITMYYVHHKNKLNKYYH